MKCFIMVITLLVIASTAVFSSTKSSMIPEDVPAILIRVPVSGEEEAKKLLDLGVQIELNMVVNDVVEGFMSASDLKRVQDAGFKVIVVEPEEEVTGRKPWYDFDDVLGILTQYTKDYPDLTYLDTAGFSLGKKPILYFRISSTPDTAARQIIYHSGATHGNEKIGTETCMLIIKYLLENYGKDRGVTELLDRSEFHFHPILNIDGFSYSERGRRTLNNGKDPNRAFSWKLGGKSSDGSLPNQWPEMKTYQRNMIDRPYFYSSDYHCGTKATLDPFFTSVDGGVMDGSAYSAVKKKYPPYSGVERWEQVYIIETRSGGISCDSPYGKNGNIALLPEMCNHYPPTSSIEKISQYHLEKFLDVNEEMQQGVCGRIRDATSGEPVYGRVTVDGKGAPVFSDPRSGAYYKYIPSPSGTFEVTVFANGYKTETKSVPAAGNAFAALDFEMTRDPEKKFAALSLDIVGLDNTASQPELYSCLELHDSNGLEVDGFIIVDFGKKTPVTDQQGAEDITVYGTGSYTLSISDDLDKITDNDGVQVGQGSGDKSFDLSSLSIDSARYARIDADGAEIDAIEAEPFDFPTGNKIHTVTPLPGNVFKVISPLSIGGDVVMQVYIPRGNYAVKVFNCKGREIAAPARGNAKAAGIKMLHWQAKRNAGNGTYIFRVTTTDGEKSVTAPVLW